MPEVSGAGTIVEATVSPFTVATIVSAVVSAGSRVHRTTIVESLVAAAVTLLGGFVVVPVVA